MAHNKKNFFSHSSGSQKPEIKVSQGHPPPETLEGSIPHLLWWLPPSDRLTSPGGRILTPLTTFKHYTGSHGTGMHGHQNTQIVRPQKYRGFDFQEAKCNWILLLPSSQGLFSHNFFSISCPQKSCMPGSSTCWSFSVEARAVMSHIQPAPQLLFSYLSCPEYAPPK